ncbi:MAG: hypothetical protein ACJ73L_02970 [Actinomycetes bacterium]
MKRSLVSLLALAAVSGLVLPAVMASSAQAVVAGPVNLAPDDNSTYQKNVVLTWDDVSGATGYEVQVSADGFGTDSDVFDDTTLSNRYVVPVDLPRSDYVWRVRATLPGATSDWSSSAQLVRGWDPSVAPSLSHVGGDSYDWSVSWTPVPDASFYEVQLSPTDFEPENTGPPYVRGDEVICFTTHTTFTGSLLSKGSENSVAEGASCEGSFDAASSYNVRVRARDGYVDARTTGFPEATNSCTGAWQSTVGDGWTGPIPECSGWSGTVSGLVLNPSVTEPSMPTNLATADVNSTCDATAACTDTPVMSWDEDPNATFYRVYLSRDRSGNDYDRIYDNIVGTQFQMYSTMNDRELPWYWRVQACSLSTDPADMCGPVSDAASFTVSNKGLKLAGASPVTGDPTIHEQYVDFTIPNEIAQADHMAKAFRIQVSTKADFSTTALTDTFDQQAGDATTTTYRWDGVSDGDYFWRYRAVDQTGLLSPWTQGGTLQFSVDASIPKVSIKTSNGWGLGDPVTLVSDKALNGANKTTLGVQLKGGAQVTGSLSQQSPTSWKFTPDGRWTPNAAYVPFVAASVTANNGKVAQGDDVVKRPTGLVDSKSAAMKKTDGDFPWKTLSSSDAIAKSYVAAKHKASSNKVPTVSVKFGGTKVSLVACQSSVGGFADILIDGAKVKSVDLYRASSKCGEVWSTSGLTDDIHTIAVKVTGKKSADSAGNYVGVDAVKAG